MNIDPGMVNQVLSALPYPVSKDQLVQLARQHGVNDQIVGILDRLPGQTFNSPQEIQSALTNPGTLGGMLHL
jgi:Protein of unknown function (DUF2795)